MSEEKLKMGIIGLGRIAMAHANAVMDLRDQIEWVAIADVRIDWAKEIADRFGVRDVYSDYHELLRDPEIEAVLICLPNYLHHPVCIDAARAGNISSWKSPWR